jgi:formiminotetrahydrofolate cyclodeaminase
VENDSLVNQTVATLLDAFAARGATPGGISVAALAAASAAALVERCAAAAPGDRQGVADRAAGLRRDLVAAADADLAVLDRLARASGEERAAAAAGASGPARVLREAASEIVRLAAVLEREGAPRLQGEARCAGLLADAAARTATAVTEANERLARS